MKKNSLLMWIPIFLIFVIILAKKPEEKKINVAVLNGPSCIPISFLMEENSNSTKCKYVFEKFATPQSVLPKMVKNEIDIAFMPLNVAAKAYNLSEKIKCVAICGNGNLSLVTKDENIKQFSDIKDKEVYVAGQGSTPEYMFLYLLNQNGIKANLNFSVPTANIPSYLIENQIDYAVLPEPFATIATNKDSNLKKAIDLQEEFKKINNDFENYPLTVIVCTKEFEKKNPTLVKEFLDEYKKSLENTLNHPKIAAEYTQKHELGLNAQIVEKIIPYSSYVYVPANEAKEQIYNLLNIFQQIDKKSIGPKLPDDNFFYSE
ncbi:MAG: ABC transporter substrate-binding protein [Clostridia bacterium]|nr:ABC transporter substrate-binding protein [Clostridia bacterium]